MQIKLKIVNKSDNPLPKYESACAAGMDIRSNEEVTLKPGEHKLVHTGLFIELPCGLDFGYEAQIRPRSGLAFKKGVTVLNSPGTIDPDYRGEIGVILINLGSEEVTLEKGERIAQMVINEFKIPEIIEVEELSETERGSGGFGHSGRK